MVDSRTMVDLIPMVDIIPMLDPTPMVDPIPMVDPYPLPSTPVYRGHFLLFGEQCDFLSDHLEIELFGRE